jgi:hypothetical protein
MIKLISSNTLLHPLSFQSLKQISDIEVARQSINNMAKQIKENNRENQIAFIRRCHQKLQTSKVEFRYFNITG